MKIQSLLLSILMSTFCFTPIVANAETENENICSLTLDCRVNDKPIVGEGFRLYHVADIDSDDVIMTPDFADSGIVIDDDSASDLSACAVTLETYIVEQENFENEIIPVAEGITDENGMLSFDELQDGVYLITGNSMTEENITYTPVASLIPLPYLDEDNDDAHYNPTVIPKIEIDEHIDDTPISTKISVEKIWSDEGYENQRPDEVSVILFQDGEKYDTVILNEENNWQYTWNDLDDNSRWQLIEENVPDGYTMTSVLEDGKFVVTNKFNPSEDTPETTTTSPTESTTSNYTTVQTITNKSVSTTVKVTTTGQTLPQTGQLKWPIPVLAGGGMVFLTIGCILRRKNSDKDEK